MKNFYSTESAAQRIGVSVRHFIRLAQDFNIQAKRYGPTEKFFYSPTQLNEIERRYRQRRDHGRTRNVPSNRAIAEAFFNLTPERQAEQTATGSNSSTHQRICIHCPHSTPHGEKCCQCNEIISAKWLETRTPVVFK